MVVHMQDRYGDTGSRRGGDTHAQSEKVPLVEWHGGSCAGPGENGGIEDSLGTRRRDDTSDYY